MFTLLLFAMLKLWHGRPVSYLVPTNGHIGNRTYHHR